MDSVTSLSLLTDLRNPTNSAAWLRFDNRFRPIITAFVHKLGVRGADLEDVVQEIMLAFIKGYSDGDYDPEKGRLRSWVFAIAHRKVIDFYRRNDIRGGSGRVAFAGLEGQLESRDREQAEKLWEQEWQRALLKTCLAEVSRIVEPKTLQAFDLYVIRDVPADKVAADLGISLNAVYLAKHKVIKHIRNVRGTLDNALW